jgi:tRNA 2-selenouridine synthase
MKIKRIKFNETVKLKNKIYIDARSPSEYAVDHIPDAVNLPLLNDSERAVIGKIYKQQGSFEARKRGVEIVSPKLKNLTDFLSDISEGFENVVFYCSRGGLRSYSLASFFSLVCDKNIFIVEKGYKEYRQFILRYFENFGKNFLVVDGYTGTGKTMILRELKRKGLPVVDLENIAKHRGSVFGGVGIKDDINQKKFETLLYKEVEIYKDFKTIIVEGESRHIGKCVLPGKFYERMNQSPHIWLDTSDEYRVNVIKEDYLKTLDNYGELVAPIEALKSFIGGKNVEMLKKEVEKENFDFVILYLLKNYYDILYKKGRLPDNKFYKKIYFSRFEEGVKAVEEIYNELNG